MKFFISMLLIFATSLVSAQDPVNIVEEAANVFNYINSYFDMIAMMTTSDIQGSRDMIHNSNLNAITGLVSAINAIGSNAESLGKRANTELTSLNKHWNSKITAQLTDALATFTCIEKQFKSLVQRDIDALKSAIKKKSSAAQCWTDNKNPIENIMQSLATQIMESISENLAPLVIPSSNNADVYFKIVETRQTAAQNLCKSEPVCTLKYVS